MNLYLNNESIGEMRKKFICYRKSMNPMQDTITCILDGDNPGKNLKIIAIKKMLFLEGEYRSFNKCWDSVPIQMDTILLQKQNLRIEK